MKLKFTRVEFNTHEVKIIMKLKFKFMNIK